jgi:hypothetical protein
MTRTQNRCRQASVRWPGAAINTVTMAECA